MPKTTQDLTQAIALAQKALEAIPFTHWENRELMPAASLLIDALALDYRDPERNRLLIEALGYLTGQLAKGFDSMRDAQKSLAQRVGYELTERITLTSEIDQPEEFLRKAIEAHEQERMAAK